MNVTEVLSPYIMSAVGKQYCHASNCFTGGLAVAPSFADRASTFDRFMQRLGVLNEQHLVCLMEQPLISDARAFYGTDVAKEEYMKLIATFRVNAGLRHNGPAASAIVYTIGDSVYTYREKPRDVQRSSDDDASAPQQISCFMHKRSNHDHPWQLTHEWTKGDRVNQRGKCQRTLCRVWYSGRTNASSWKAHLRSKLGISGSGTASSGQGTVLVQSTLGKVVFPDGVLRKFENAIVDYVVGGGIVLRAAGGQRFKKLVVSLTNGYEQPSTRTILRRIVELFRIAEPLLLSFVRKLDVAISLMPDGWGNRT
jgi:hypothetical protein